jgi:hypothetical protein
MGADMDGRVDYFKGKKLFVGDIFLAYYPLTQKIPDLAGKGLTHKDAVKFLDPRFMGNPFDLDVMDLKGLIADRKAQINDLHYLLGAQLRINHLLDFIDSGILSNFFGAYLGAERLLQGDDGLNHFGRINADRVDQGHVIF